ncbi:MAG: hypothetical protein RMJ39_10405 [Deltaproteobacteria bacterium]|nr:hypothetical protein [Deltaproteobacteria bacterium]
MMRSNISEAEFIKMNERLFSDCLRKVLRSLGYRLKLDMANAIRRGLMGWPLIKRLTQELREYMPHVKFAGVWFARFIRYGVEEYGDGRFTLRVGVFNPGRIKPLSGTILTGARRFVRGWRAKVTEAMRKKLIMKYLKKKKIVWSNLSPEEKKEVRKKMREAGVLVRTGTILYSPERPVTRYIEMIRDRTQKEIATLFSMALRGERWPKKWWVEIVV